MGIEFRKATPAETKQLAEALRGNAESNLAILMDRRDTSFLGTTDEVADDEVISAIQSVPCHYSDGWVEFTVPESMPSWSNSEPFPVGSIVDAACNRCQGIGRIVFLWFFKRKCPECSGKGRCFYRCIGSSEH